MAEAETQSENIQCCICLDINTNVKLGECKHEYHFHCIEKWTQTKKTCPYCRADIKCVMGKYISWQIGSLRNLRKMIFRSTKDDILRKIYIHLIHEYRIQNVHASVEYLHNQSDTHMAYLYKTDEEKKLFNKMLAWFIFIKKF